MNLKVNVGTVDVNGQTLGAGTWANLVAQTAGAVLRNSSTNAATIANGNTIWIWAAATNLTINTSAGDLQIDSRITSSGQPTPTGIIKTGTNSLVLTFANDYTGTTAINAGRIVVANSSALGSTENGTVVASGAQLMLTNVTVGNEALNISGAGLASGSSIAGALRSLGTNTYQGKVTLGANATIFGGSGTSLTLDVASGDAVDLATHTLTIDGAGASQITDRIVGTGGISKAGSGTLTLAASNSFTGNTVVSTGVLNLNSATGSALGASANLTVSATLLVSQSGQVNDSAAVTLSGGTIQRGSGVSEVFGNLNLTTGSFLNFGTGDTGNLTFGTYQNNETPSALLTLNNFLPGNSFTFSSTSFSTNSVGSYFAFGTGYVGSSISNDGSTFTITAIPEPSTYLAAAGLLAVLLWPSRRRLLNDVKSVLGLRGPMRDRLSQRS
jgi:autotransporter-associated beta strand protein